MITWPQLTPHRVTNLEGLNVSLSTEHKNPRARRRLNVYQANHFLRSRCGIAPSTCHIDGLTSHFKQALARTIRYSSRLLNKQQGQFVYPKSFIVDPNEPRGFRLLNNDNNSLVAPHLEHELVAV